MKCDWGLLCDHASIGPSGKYSLVDVFDRVSPPRLPAAYPVLYVVFWLSAEPGTNHAVELRIWSPSAQLVSTTPPRQFAFSAAGTALAINQIPGMSLPEAGEYTFEVLGDGVSLRRLKLTVAVGDVPNAAS